MQCYTHTAYTHVPETAHLQDTQVCPCLLNSHVILYGLEELAYVHEALVANKFCSLHSKTCLQSPALGPESLPRCHQPDLESRRKLIRNVPKSPQQEYQTMKCVTPRI